MLLFRGRGTARVPLLTIGLMGVSLAMASCGEEAAGTTATQRPDGGDTTPTIYVDRLVEHGDREAVQEGYQQAAALCREAGIPVSPLSEEDVAKIGTERWRLWHGPDQRAYRVESWTWGYTSEARQSAADNCRFALSVDGQHEYLDAHQSFHIDLATNEKTTDAADAGELETSPATPPTEEDFVQARDVVGATGPANRTIAGQPCQEWSYSPGATACVWTGGLQWGFAYGPDRPFASIDGFDPGSIVLHAEPAPGTEGDRLTTTVFAINAPLNLDEMKAIGGDGPSGSGDSR